MLVIYTPPLQYIFQTEPLTLQGRLLYSVPDPPDPQVLGLLDPDPDPLVRGMDPDPDPSIIMQK
jgi:hypothetical protein